LDPQSRPVPRFHPWSIALAGRKIIVDNRDYQAAIAIKLA